MGICRSQDEISREFLAASAADEVLVTAAKSGHGPAFAELWERHSKRAFKKVHRITRNQADTEDAIQEAWMKAYLHLKTFDGRCAFSTWLTRIAINSALMTLRRRRSRPEACMEVMDQGIWRQRDVVDHGKNAEQHYLRQENVERLRRAIRGLNPSLRTVVEIHQSNDGQVKEIAEIAGISISATKSRLLRARINLRRRLDFHNPAATKSEQKTVASSQ